MRKWIVALLLVGVTAMNCGFLITGYHRDIPAETLRAELAVDASQFIDAAGASVHVVDQGSTTPAQPPLMLIHGTGSSLFTWDGWVDELDDGFRLIRLDLPGFGLTGPNRDDDYSIDRYVATVAAVLDHLAVPRVDLAGNSLGGEVAWRFALAHPDRVRHLVLIDAAGYPRVDAKGNVLSVGKVPFLRRLLRKVTPKFLVEEGLRDVYVDDSLITPVLIERHHRLLLREGNRDALVARLDTPFEDRHAEISQIEQPTLILWGAQDTWIPPADARRFAADLPNARLILYEDLGHVPMEEAPARTAADVRTFLRTPASR